MAFLSIDGLASGLDTTAIIAQLMAAERAPVQRLQTRQAGWDAKVAAWGEIAAKLDTLDAALEAFDSLDDFAVFKGASSNPSRLTVSAGGTAVPGATLLKVTSLATAHQIMSGAGYASATTAVTPGGTGRISVGSKLDALGVTTWSDTGLAAGKHTVEIVETAGGHGVKLDGADPVDIVGGTVTIGGLTLDFAGTPQTGTLATVTVGVTDGETSLAGLAGQLTTADGPFSAQVLDLGGGAQPSRLLVTASATGTAAVLDIKTDIAGLGTFADLQQAKDAVIVVGDGTNPDSTVSRATNTVSDLMPGVTFNLLQAGDEQLTVTVSRDTDAVVAKVKAIVDALNGVVGTMKSKSKSGENSTNPLRGDATIRSLTASLAQSVGAQLADPAEGAPYAHHLLSELGISSTRDGTWSFDDTKLRAALASDPTGTGTALVALTQPLRDWVATADGPAGVVARAKESAQTQASAVKDSIAAFEQRLTLRETRYRRQFAELERMLGQLQSQSSWLASQIANLPKTEL